MTKLLAALTVSAALLPVPAIALDHHLADGPAQPTYAECVAEWTEFFGTDTSYDDATRAIAIDGLSGEERARMQTCDAMLDGGRALQTGQ